MALNFPWWQAAVFLIGFLFAGIDIFYIFAKFSIQKGWMAFLAGGWIAGTFVSGIIKLIAYNLWIKYSERQTGKAQKVFCFNWRAYRVRAFFQWIRIGYMLLFLGCAYRELFGKYKLWAELLCGTGLLAYFAFLLWWQFHIRKKGTNGGIIFLLCIGVSVFCILAGGAAGQIDPALYKRETEEVRAVPQEEAFVQEQDLGIEIKGTAERYGEKNGSCLEAWEEYTVREIQEEDASGNFVFSYEMYCTEYRWLLDMEQRLAVRGIKEIRETASETRMDGAWVCAGQCRKKEGSGNTYTVRRIVLRRDKVLLVLNYVVERTSEEESEIIERAAHKVRIKAESR